VNDGLRETRRAIVAFSDNFPENAVGNTKRISHDRRFQGQMGNPERSSATQERYLLSGDGLRTEKE
jgi:hypothetical protein